MSLDLKLDYLRRQVALNPKSVEAVEALLTHMKRCGAPRVRIAACDCGCGTIPRIRYDSGKGFTGIDGLSCKYPESILIHCGEHSRDAIY